MNKQKENFTRYELARIIGARALQIAMDAPILIKISDDELKKIRYDSIKIAEKELEADALPITIHRPNPKKRQGKIETIKEENVSDDELIAKEQEIEKEIHENIEEYSLVQEDEESAETEEIKIEEQ